MPEHKAMLKHVEMDDMKMEKPILDEGQLQEFNNCLFKAFKINWKLD
ncbi:YolD-like family protein [Neobacillus sp. SCS-31]